MTTNLDKCLETLEALSHQKLHQTNCKLRSDLGCTEWRLAMSLLASQRRNLHRQMDYSSVTDYAEKALELAPQKTMELISAARVMSRLPRFSQAFRQGRLSWSKVRSLKRVITPETEDVWMDYALDHTAREVERRVVQSPRSWKRSQAPHEAQPSAGAAQELFQPALPATRAAAQSATTRVPTPEEPEEEPAEEPAEVSPLPGPKYIRVSFDLTPDQWAIYEEMERRVWAKRGRKVPRAEVLVELCQVGLDRGSSKARARHQVIIHANEQGQAWYETERGALPVNPQVLDQALKERPALIAADLEATSARNEEPPPQTSTTKPEAPTSTGEPEPDLGTSTWKSRASISNPVLRAVHARAGNRCERCGARGQLCVHHKKPRSDGGSNQIENLELVCLPCHGLLHEPDFEQRPDWVRARERSLEAHPRTPEGPESMSAILPNSG